MRQEDLLRFAPKGQLTILHMADCHAQLKPIYFREPSLNLGVGEARGQLPHLVGQDFLASFGIAASSLEAYMLTSADFEALAKTYGRVGGMDRLATLVNADPRPSAAPSACCCSTAATRCRAPTRRCKPRAPTWSR